VCKRDTHIGGHSLIEPLIIIQVSIDSGTNHQTVGNALHNTLIEHNVSLSKMEGMNVEPDESSYGSIEHADEDDLRMQMLNLLKRARNEKDAKTYCAPSEPTSDRGEHPVEQSDDYNQWHNNPLVNYVFLK